MPRLGEILVAAGVLTVDQLDEGLRAQVLYGGRLGTNLVELGHVELDKVAQALARQQNIPAAMKAHFDRCDPGLQALLPVALAARWSVVPIGYLTEDRRRAAVAGLGAIPAAAHGEIADALGCEVVLAVAAELRILYYLERTYGVPRSNRFLRVRRASSHNIAPIPVGWDDVSVPVVTGLAAAVEAAAVAEADRARPAPVHLPPEVGPPVEASVVAARPRAQRVERTIEGAPRLHPRRDPTAPAEDTATARFDRLEADDGPGTGTAPIWPADDDRAVTRPRYRPAPPVAAEADDGDDADAELDFDRPDPTTTTAAVAPARSIALVAPTDFELDVATPAGGTTQFEPALSDSAERRRFVQTLSELDAYRPAALGRIAIRRVAPGAAPGAVVAAAPAPPPVVDVDAIDIAGASLTDTLRAIRRATGRDRVGDLVLEALGHHGASAVDLAVILVIRESVAFGWKGFVRRADEPAFDTIAVPLDEPSLVSSAWTRRVPVAAAVGDHGTTEIDHRLWAALGDPSPIAVADVPVALGDHVVCVLHAHGRDPAGLGGLLVSLAEATVTAFARLLRAAQR